MPPDFRKLQREREKKKRAERKAEQEKERKADRDRGRQGDQHDGGRNRGDGHSKNQGQADLPGKRPSLSESATLSIEVEEFHTPVNSFSFAPEPVLVILEPWDLLRGLCMFKMRDRLDGETSLANLSHYTPNCATFSRAREISIPGVKSHRIH